MDPATRKRQESVAHFEGAAPASTCDGPSSPSTVPEVRMVNSAKRPKLAEVSVNTPAQIDGVVPVLKLRSPPGSGHSGG